MKLTTKRLILRYIKRADAESIRKYINNLNVSRYLLAVPYPYTKKDVEWWVNECQKRQGRKPRDSYELAITIKPDTKVVGGVGLSKVDKTNGTAEIGYWIAEPYWRQGYVSEAVIKMIGFGFNKLKLRRLVIPAFAENKGSNGLAKKLGFKYEGCLRQAAKCKATGKIHDENIYGLLKKDWRKGR